MLKFFRKKHIAKTIFWGLVILILPAFVFWGTGSLSRSKDRAPSFVGFINKKRVSFDELYESTTGMRTLMILNYFNQPQVLDAFLKNKPLLAKLGWDRLVMLKETKKYKIKIPDKDVIDYIRSHPLFLRDGKFDDKIYEYVLRYNIGLGLRAFEETVRDNLEIRRLNEILTKDIKISDEEILNEYRTYNEKFKISYILIEAKGFIDEANIDESEMKDYYEKHAKEFVLPAKEGEGEAKARLGDFEDVKTSIRSHLAERHARASSIEYAKGVYKKITELTKEGKKETFEEACSKLGLKILETPFFSRPDYIEGLGEASILVDAALALKSNQISNPIEMRKGVVIFKILESKGIDEDKFEKEKEVFAKKALDEKKTKIVDEWFNKISINSALNIDLADIEKYYR